MQHCDGMRGTEESQLKPLTLSSFEVMCGCLSQHIQSPCTASPSETIQNIQLPRRWLSKSWDTTTQITNPTKFSSSKGKAYLSVIIEEMTDVRKVVFRSQIWRHFWYCPKMYLCKMILLHQTSNQRKNRLTALKTVAFWRSFLSLHYPKNFKFTPSGVIYTCSPTSGLGGGTEFWGDGDHHVFPVPFRKSKDQNLSILVAFLLEVSTIKLCWEIVNNIKIGEKWAEK